MTLLHSAAARAQHYLDGLPERRVAPTPADAAGLAAFDIPLPDLPTDPEWVLAELDQHGSPGTVASAGPRYFGFVIGGSLPAALAANWLAAAWDQNAGLLGDVAHGRHPGDGGAALAGGPARPAARHRRGFVTGATMANFTALAAARHALLARAGLERGGRRPVRRAADHRGGGRRGACLHGQGAGAGRLWARARGARAGGRPGPDARRRAAPAERPHDRVRPGRQRQHRRLRPGGRGVRRRARRRGLGARGRRLWAVGGGGAGARPPGGRRGRGRLVGHRRAQVAERALRQRAGLRARPAGAAGGHVASAPPTCRRARRASRRSSRPSCRAGRAGWRSGPRCARWAARGWPS